MAQLIFINSNPHQNLVARVSVAAMVSVCVWQKCLSEKLLLLHCMCLCVLAVTAGA